MFRNLKSKYYRWLAKRKLIKRYEYLIEVNRLMEEFDVFRITQFNESNRRNDLISVQNEIKGSEQLIDFLKGLKK